MTKLMICGDWHGNETHARKMIDLAHEKQVDTIVQVGDFGWWPHYADMAPYIGRIDDALDKRNIELLWLDGNHENFDDLETRWFDPDSDGIRYYQRPYSARMLRRVGYLPRGTVFRLGQSKAMAFGGAASVDKLMRTEGRSWWRQELPRMSEVNAALDNAMPVDLMFTHDAPAFPVGLPQGWKEDPASTNNRAAVNALMEAYQPQALFHGHYHHPYKTTIGETEVYGLGADRNLDGSDNGCYLVMEV